MTTKTKEPADKAEPAPKPRPQWRAILMEALTKPGVPNEAYHLFHNFSLGNAIWAASQILGRGMTMGPVASFSRWKTLGRSVKKGEKGIAMWRPIMVYPGKKKDDGKPESATVFTSAPGLEPEHGEATESPRRVFIVQSGWFTLDQTEPMEGVEQPASFKSELGAAPAGLSYSLKTAFENLGLAFVPFEDINGNCMGYAYPKKKQFAVSPIASDKFKTSIHEIAHCLLHADQEQFVDGAELTRSIREVEAESTAYLVCATLGHKAPLDTMRHYIQHWMSLTDQPFTDANARRIFYAADKILRAGAVEPKAAAPEAGLEKAAA